MQRDARRRGRTARCIKSRDVIVSLRHRSSGGRSPIKGKNVQAEQARAQPSGRCQPGTAAVKQYIQTCNAPPRGREMRFSKITIHRGSPAVIEGQRAASISPMRTNDQVRSTSCPGRRAGAAPKPAGTTARPRTYVVHHNREHPQPSLWDTPVAPDLAGNRRSTVYAHVMCIHIWRISWRQQNASHCR